MLPVSKALQGRLNRDVHTLATCWKIERKDGVTMKFTDHDTTLNLSDNPATPDVYIPAGGFNASARQKTSGLNPQNLEIVGVLSSDAITHEDLLMGRYKDAKITEIVVDYTQPWVGYFLKNTFWISETTYSEKGWTAKLEGLVRNLQLEVGRVYNKTCRHTLGDTGCKKLLTPFIVSVAQITEVISEYKSFKVASLIGLTTNFTDGKLQFLNGANQALWGEIKLFDSTDGKIELQMSMRAPIALHNNIRVYPGCNKTWSMCVGTYSNGANYGGYPFIPGTDSMMDYPDAR